MRTIFLDFETAYSSEYSLSKMPPHEYVRDPRFQVIGCAVQVDDGALDWLEAADFERWAATIDWTQTAACAHNGSLFDFFILTERFSIHPAFLYDTLSLGAALHGASVGGSLKKLSEYYDVGAKGDEILRTLGKWRKDFTQEEWLRYGEYAKQDVRLMKHLFEKMTVGFPAPELAVIDLTARFFCEPEFEVDQELLQAYLASEGERKEDLLRRVGGENPRSVLMSNDKFAALLLERGVTPPMKPSPKQKHEDGTPKMVYAFAKSDSEFQELAESDDDEVALLCKARLETKSTINVSRTERFLKAGENGRKLPVGLKYFGAHTGRWSGSISLNQQNLPKGGTLRKSMLAPAGHAVVVCDLSAIEARVLAFIAGYQTRLDLFSRHDREKAEGLKPDFYSEIGEGYFQKKITKKDPERDWTKSLELGLQFGMGHFKFATVMLNQNKVRFTAEHAEKFGVNVPAFVNMKTGRRFNRQVLEETPTRLEFDELATHTAVTAYLVKLYRQNNPAVIEMWSSCGDLLEAMTELAPGESVLFGPNKCLAVEREAIRLPSGLKLKYPGLACGERGYTFKGRNGKIEYIHGSLLGQNITQAVARSILAGQILTIAARYKVVTCVHDEIVCIVPEAQAEECLGFMLSTMRQAEEWTAGLPLNAEGGYGRSYGDAK